MLYDFGNAMLRAIGDRLEENKTNHIMQSWAQLLTFVLFHMTSEKVNFVAVTSRREYSQSRKDSSVVPDTETRAESGAAIEFGGPVDDAFAFMPSDGDLNDDVVDIDD
jgi:transposase